MYHGERWALDIDVCLALVAGLQAQLRATGPFILAGILHLMVLQFISFVVYQERCGIALSFG